MTTMHQVDAVDVTLVMALGFASGLCFMGIGCFMIWQSMALCAGRG